MNQPVGFQDKVSFIWSVADLLRGDFKAHEYGQVVLPLVVLRRLVGSHASASVALGRVLRHSPSYGVLKPEPPPSQTLCRSYASWTSTTGDGLT